MIEPFFNYFIKIMRKYDIEYDMKQKAKTFEEACRTQKALKKKWLILAFFSIANANKLPIFFILYKFPSRIPMILKFIIHAKKQLERKLTWQATETFILP